MSTHNLDGKLCEQKERHCANDDFATAIDGVQSKNEYYW